ncbi:AI-2E family transporter [Candidatus Wolfebacteria bacterium]|nr:AI-2E family transporter [Candidatus Wolfebacteria bacterium]
MSPLEVSWASLWRIFLMIILAGALYLTRDVLLILFLAIIIAAALDGIINFLERKRIPRILGAFFVFLALLGMVALILYTVIPVAIVEFKTLLASVSKLSLPVFGSFDAADWFQNVDKKLGAWADTLFSGGVSLFDFIGKIFGNVILIITTFVLAFYLTISRDGVERFLKTILPANYEDYAIDVYHRVRKKMGLWFQGQLILMLAVGVLVFTGLRILGVKYSLILAILTGFLEIVPVAGPIFSGILASLVAFSDSWVLTFWTAGLFLIIQQIENHLLVPVVMRKTVGVSPVVVVIAILAGSKIAGLTGILLAVPATIIFQELLSDWEIRKARIKGNRLEV